CLAAMGFIAMSPIFWTLPTEYMTGYAAAAGIALINSLGNLGGFLAPIQRDYIKERFGGNTGLYSLAVGAVAAAVLFAVSAFFKKANEIEAGHLDQVDAMYVPHKQAEAAREAHRATRESMRALVLRDHYDIAVEERPDPVAGPGQVVVDVIATGICGSDFH